MDRRALLLGPLPAVVLAGCGTAAVANQTTNASSADSTTDESQSSAETTTTLEELATADDQANSLDEPIAMSMTLYLVEDALDPPDSPLSSQRTPEGLSIIAEDMGEVWSQANIVFDPVTIETVQLPRDVLEAIALGLDTGPFFDQVGNTFDLPNPSALNGLYVRAAGRANGFAPSGSRVFFVIDEPSVHDERVSSHEVGHILGLHHDLEDPGTLMFSGTNGTVLSGIERTVARYTAGGVLNGAR